MNVRLTPTAEYRACRSQRPAKRAGVAAVEAAVTLPLLILLVFGSMEVANVELNNLNFIKQTAANAAYEGARAAIVAGGSAVAASQRARATLDTFGVGSGALISISDAGDRVRVSVRVPAHLNSYGLSRFTGNLHVTQACTLSRERHQAAAP